MLVHGRTRPLVLLIVVEGRPLLHLCEIKLSRSKKNIGLNIGSTRATRFADLPAQWMLKQAQAREDMTDELVDLRDYNLPMFADMASNANMPTADAGVAVWQKKLAEFDGYIFVIAEYNHAVSGSLKNAVQHLRSIAVDLQSVPLRNSAHIGSGDFWNAHPAIGGSGSLADVTDAILPSARLTLYDVVWWAKATMAARG